VTYFRGQKLSTS